MLSNSGLYLLALASNVASEILLLPVFMPHL
jgi:hypothetical protein